MGFKDWFRPRRIEQAQALPAHTPKPSLDEWGDTDGGPPSIFTLFEPSPDHVNYVFLHSDEWGDVVTGIRMETWRRGLEIIPSHPFFCADCGEPADEETEPCTKCGSIGRMTPPNPAEKRVLENWLHEANREHDGLIEVGERKTEEGLKHGRSVVVFRFEYELEDDGRIRTMNLREVLAGDPGKIYKLKDKRGRTGGKFVCLACRTQSGYKPEAKAARCPTCGGVLYEARWVEYATYSNATPIAWWLPEEVHESRWPYKDGSSPASRLWNKLVALMWMDRYASQATDPRVPQRPDKILATIGGDAAAMADWARRDAEERKRNRYKLSHLHIPTPPGGLAELKMDAKVLDLGDREFKMQSLELREKFERRIRAHYHMSPIQGGDTQAGGGLNNEGLQLRSTAQVAEDLQVLEEQWLQRLVYYLGVVEWTFRFPPALEENEGRVADAVQKELLNASSARNLGLQVHWRNDKAVIPDGEVKPPPPNPFGTQDGESSSPSGTPGKPPEESQDVPEVEQAISDDSDLTGGVSVILTGPSGAVAAGDALWGNYQGVSADLSRQIGAEIVRSLSQPQGWSVDSISRRIQPMLEAAGVEDAEARARTIARTEVRSIASTWKERLYRVQETERGQPGMYRIRGARDHRRTKLSWWIDQQVGGGKALDEVTRIMDEGITLAKQGAFAKGGTLEGTLGTPIRLPSGFNRRGFLAHYNDRDEVVEVV